jgi:biopolymer transport protein ExbD
MRLPDLHPRSGVGFNMTPMIDVVFLLIIFFLVSSHLAKQESQLVLPLPVADSGQEAIASDTPRITINVLQDGTVITAGRTLSLDQLRSRLAQRRAAEGVDLEVRIRSDRHVPYHFVEPILLACARADIWNVTFAVYRSEDVR